MIGPPPRLVWALKGKPFLPKKWGLEGLVVHGAARVEGCAWKLQTLLNHFIIIKLKDIVCVCVCMLC